MKVLIHFMEESEPGLLAACLLRAKRFYGKDSDTSDITVEIFCRERQKDGWAEYAMVLPYTDSSAKLQVAAIQRQPLGDIEFHS